MQRTPQSPDSALTIESAVDLTSSGPRATRLARLAALFPIGAVVFSIACFSERGGGPSGPEVREESLIEIRLTDFAFTPAHIIINRGARVRWINTTNTFHTVTPDGHAAWQRWPTSSGGDTLEHEFTSTGEFGYLCEPHRSIGMVGSITVR